MTELPDHPLSSVSTDIPSPPDTTRRNFLALGALAGAAAIVLPALPARALDLGLASQLKFLENAGFFQNQFFARALRSGSIDPLTPAEGAILMTIAGEDSEQARWFRAVRAKRGLMPSRATMPSSITDPNFNVGGAYGNRAKFFDSALAIKSAVVGAFHGIVGKGGDAETVQAIAALAGVQNRHLAMLRELNGLDPFDTYVQALGLQEAGNTLSKYGFGTEVN